MCKQLRMEDIEYQVCKNISKVTSKPLSEVIQVHKKTSNRLKTQNSIHKLDKTYKIINSPFYKFVFYIKNFFR